MEQRVNFLRTSKRHANNLTNAGILKSYILYGLGFGTIMWMKFCEKYEFDYEILYGFMASYGTVALFIFGIWYFTMKR